MDIGWSPAEEEFRAEVRDWLQPLPGELRRIEEARLSREVTIAENLYTTLQGRYEEARLAEVSAVPDVRVR